MHWEEMEAKTAGICTPVREEGVSSTPPGSSSRSNKLTGDGVTGEKTRFNYVWGRQRGRMREGAVNQSLVKAREGKGQRQVPRRMQSKKAFTNTGRSDRFGFTTIAGPEGKIKTEWYG